MRAIIAGRNSLVGSQIVVGEHILAGNCQESVSLCEKHATERINIRLRRLLRRVAARAVAWGASVLLGRRLLVAVLWLLAVEFLSRHYGGCTWMTVSLWGKDRNQRKAMDGFGESSKAAGR